MTYAPETRKMAAECESQANHAVRGEPVSQFCRKPLIPRALLSRGPTRSICRIKACGRPLLDHYCRLKDRRLLPPLAFPLALLVGRVLACSDLVECAPFCFHPRMGIPREHCARDVAGDTHDHLVARTRLGSPPT